MPLPVALDVDTGVDDACALLLAALHPGLDLRAVTCVEGNAPVDGVVHNTLTVLETAGRGDVPVARGAARPLLEPPAGTRRVHGEDGMADLGYPSPRSAVDTRGAAELLRDVASAAADEGEPLVVVTLAPMTNLALFARLSPEAFSGVARVVFVGGGADVSEASAVTEFNVAHDPDAAAIVLDACTTYEVPVTMYGLDVFSVPVVDTGGVDALRASGLPPARLAASLVRHQLARFGSSAAAIGDAGAVASLLLPAAVRTEPLPLHVELADPATRGRTVVDRRHEAGSPGRDPHASTPATVDVALDVDGAALADLWLRTVGGLS